ncbi:MAG: dihydrofolate reductase family protein [Acidimicrobiales bacterium]
MSKVRVHNFSISIDGYAAGPGQTLDVPLGTGGRLLHEWVFNTRAGRQMIGEDGGGEGIDDEFFAQREVGIGATIMGRNMFGPIRGPWGDGQWSGWWGENPPFHCPVFVLSHHPRPPIEMQGGTTFHFVDAGIKVALERAREAANGNDVLIGGGAATVREYLAAGLINEMHLVIVPVLLGSGERLFEDLSGIGNTYHCAEHVSSPAVIHVRLSRMEPSAR